MKVRRFLGALGAVLALALAAPAWAAGPAARLVTVAQPVSKAPTLASLPPPVFAVDLNFRIVGGYKGPLFRVANAGAAQRDCSNAACADAFVATTIIGGYDQVSGELVTSSTPLTYVKTSTGLVSGFVMTNASGARTLTLPAGLLSAFSGKTGATASLVMGMHSAAPAASLNILNISTGTTAANSRYGLSILTDFAMRVNGRRLDADANANIDYGDFRGGVELVGATWDHNTATARAYRYGRVSFPKSGFLTTGLGDTTDSLAATIAIPIGGTFYSAALWNTPISTTQDVGLLAWQRWNYGHLRTIFADGAASWWVAPNPIDLGNGKINFGFSNAAGVQIKTEIDIATRLPTDWFVLDGGRWAPDDHHGQPAVVLGNGQLVEVYTGHGNSLSGSLDGMINARVSKTQRIADLGDELTLSTNLLAANYMQGFAIGLADGVWMTNDDADASWLPIRYQDGTFSQGLRLVRQTTAPGGGQNQLYSLSAKVSADSLRQFYSPHPSNAQNSIYLAAWNAVTGELTSGAGGATSYGSSWPGPGSVGTALTPVTALSAIYTPASGKSVRLVDLKSDGSRLLVVEFDAGATTNAVYRELVFTGSDPFLAADWTMGPPIVSAGAAFYSAGAAGSYFGGAVYANEPHAGLRIYVSREASATWYIDRMDSADNGQTWATVNVTSSTTKLVRPMSPRNSTTAIVGYYAFGDYTTFNTWRGRPVFAVAP